jgi:hypothetical protein
MQGQATLAARRALLLTVLVLGLLTGCASLGLHQATPGSATVQKAMAEIPEAQLLDVWIALFDPGELPKDEDDAMGLSLDIREAEARFMPVHLRNTLEKTGYWGAVRVVPRGTAGAEVLVEGTIQASNGETLALEITASDATGRSRTIRAPPRKRPRSFSRCITPLPTIWPGIVCAGRHRTSVPFGGWRHCGLRKTWRRTPLPVISG